MVVRFFTVRHARMVLSLEVLSVRHTWTASNNNFFVLMLLLPLSGGTSMAARKFHLALPYFLHCKFQFAGTWTRKAGIVQKPTVKVPSVLAAKACFQSASCPLSH
jgi:hypothetical protein